MNITGSGQGTQSYGILSPLDLYKREIKQEYIQKTMRQSAISWLRATEGRWTKRHTNRHSYSFYEAGNWLNAAAKIASVTPSGAKFVIVLEAGSHESLNGTNNVSYPVKNELVMFQDGKTWGFIESVDRSTDGAHAITVQKASATHDIGSVAQAGTTMVFATNAQPEGSRKTENRVPRFDKVTNEIQTIRDLCSVKDHEMQNVLEFPVHDGSTLLWHENLLDTGERFEMAIESALLVGPELDGVVDAEGNPIKSTTGLVPQVQQEGGTVLYYNRPDLTDFQALNLLLKTKFGDKSYMVGMGMELRQNLTAFTVEFSKGGTGNINWTQVGGNTKALEMNIEGIHIDGYSYFFHTWEIFSHPTHLGAAGMPFLGNGLFIPLGMTRAYDPDGTAGQTGQRSMEPYFQVTYSKPPFAPQHIHDDHAIWDDGALSRGGAIGEIAELNIHMQGYYSMEARCRNKFAWWEAA